MPRVDTTDCPPQRSQAVRSRSNRPCRCSRGPRCLPETPNHPGEAGVGLGPKAWERHMVDQAQRRGLSQNVARIDSDLVGDSSRAEEDTAEHRLLVAVDKGMIERAGRGWLAPGSEI